MFLVLSFVSTLLISNSITLKNVKNDYFENQKKVEKFNICNICDNIEYVKLPTPMVVVKKQKKSN